MTADGLDLEDGRYLFEVVNLNTDISTYPVKVEPFGLAYESEMFGVGDFYAAACSSAAQIVSVPDAALEGLVRAEAGIPSGDLTCGDMALVNTINAWDAGVASLEGLQYAVNLTELFLHNGDVTDISPIAGLIQLRNLNLNLHEVTDVGLLRNLTALTELHLCCTEGNITDAEPLEGLTEIVGLNLSGHHLGDAVIWPLLTNYPNLLRLWIGESDLTDFSALADHPNLEVLQASGNVINDMTTIADLENLYELQLHWADIADLTPLHSMTQLGYLDMRGLELDDISFLEGFENLYHLNLASNAVTSLAPLVANPGIGAGDFVDVSDNPLDLNDATVQAQIQALEDRGVDLQLE